MNRSQPVGKRSSAWHEAKAQATKGAVLAGAARVFDRVGYRNAVVSEISRESNTTAGAMYHYYPSKEAVALAVIADSREQLLALFAGDYASPLDALVRIPAELTRRFAEDPQTRASLRMVLEPGTFHEHPLDFLQAWQEATTELVHAAIRAGELRASVEPEATARLLIIAVVGACTLASVEADASAGGATTQLADDVRGNLHAILERLLAPEQASRLHELLEESFSREQ